MPLPSEQIEEYRQLCEEIYGEPLSFDDAKEEYTRLRLLWWILAHPPPAPGEEPYDPPPPPWL